MVLRSPHIGNRLLTRSQYKQMVGRAGRSGLCKSGESILLLQDKDRHQVRGRPCDLRSCLSSYIGARIQCDGQMGVVCLFVCLLFVQVLDILSGPCERCASSLLVDEHSALMSLLLSLIGLKVGHVIFRD